MSSTLVVPKAPQLLPKPLPEGLLLEPGTFVLPPSVAPAAIMEQSLSVPLTREPVSVASTLLQSPFASEEEARSTEAELPSTDAKKPVPADVVNALSGIPDNDLYGILGAASGSKLSADSTDREIKRAHRCACLMLHPDKLRDEGIGCDGWNRVRLAYAVLSDATRRARFDSGEVMNFDSLLHSADSCAEQEAFALQGSEPGEFFKFFMGDKRLVDHCSRISLFKPAMKNMARKLKGNRRGEVSYVSKNAQRGHAINVMFHDGEWKWLRSKLKYSNDELVQALETEQKLSRIGMEAFGLGKGHTQDWLRDLERQGYGHTPEGRENLTATAHDQLKALQYVEVGSDAATASECADSGRANNEMAMTRTSQPCVALKQLVPQQQAQLQLAIMRHAHQDAGRTLEAGGYQEAAKVLCCVC